MAFLNLNFMQPTIWTSKQPPDILQIDSEPTCLQNVLTYPSWKKAMDEEFGALIQNHT